MINYNSQKISIIYYNNKKIAQAYYNNYKVYQAEYEVYVSGIVPLELKNSLGKDLVDWSITGNTYQASQPSPSSPVPVLGVGDRTGNLFDGEMVNNESVEVTTGRFLPAAGRSRSNFILIKPNTQYTLSSNYPFRSVVGFDKDKNYIKWLYDDTTKKTVTITTQDNAQYIAFALASYGNDKRVQLELGSTPLPYEPYGVKIPVVSRGKNLLNILRDVESAETYGVKAIYKTNNTIKVSGTVQRTSNYGVGAVLLSENTLDLNLKVGEVYTLSITGRRSNNFYVQINGKDKSGTNFALGNLLNGINKRTFTVPEIFDRVEGLFVGIYGSAYGEIIDEEITIQLEEGLEVSSFEPYRPPITTTQYLPTPLMANERLTPTAREVKWGKLVLTGDENFSPNDKITTISVSDAIGVSMASITNAKCTHYMAKSYSSIYNGVQFGFAQRQGATISARGFGFSLQDGQTTKDFKSFLKSEYDAGHPVTVWYQLANPTSEPVTTTPIGTLDGECWIDVDTEVRPVSMSATYKSSKPDNDMQLLMELFKEV